MSGWQCDDPEWMKARKAEWLHVKIALEVMKGDIKTKAMKPLREYFLTGQLPPEKEQRFILNGRFLLIRLWFHPDSSTETFQRLVDETPKSFELDYAKTIFFKYQDGVYKFQSPYYFMGGKEEALTHFFVPNEVRDDCLESRYVNYTHPIGFIDNFIVRTIGFLTADCEDNKYLAHQYLINYLDSCIQHYGDQSKYLTKAKHQPTLEAWLNVIAHFDKSSIPEARVENVEGFVQKMRKGLDAGRFGDKLQGIWQKVKDTTE